MAQTMRIGLLGLGNIGNHHAQYLLNNEVAGAELTAVCDLQPEKLDAARNRWGDRLTYYSDKESFMSSGSIDGILIATPHYDHPETAIQAFGHGLHVLCEKPAGVHTKHVREMNEAAAKSNTVFSIMFNQRTIPLYRKLKDWIETGELGQIRRINWTITDWYRPQAYYDSSGWRATWAGEGGGVLINQVPHQLDMWHWLTGMMPSRIRAFCHFGKYRNIEVEDEVTAYMEYANGATGVFTTTTGEAPGTNRLEIAAERGKVVVENNELTFWRLRVPEPEFNRTNKLPFGAPECWKMTADINGKEPGHKGITLNWVNAVLHGEPLLAPGEEGIKGLQLSNAMLLSTWTDQWVELPFDEDLFYNHLQDKIAQSAAGKRG